MSRPAAENPSSETDMCRISRRCASLLMSSPGSSHAAGVCGKVSWWSPVGGTTAYVLVDRPSRWNSSLNLGFAQPALLLSLGREQACACDCFRREPVTADLDWGDCLLVPARASRRLRESVVGEGRRGGGGACARWSVVVCPRTPRLTSALDPGWLRAGGMMCDGVFRQMVVRPLILSGPSPSRGRRVGSNLATS